MTDKEQTVTPAQGRPMETAPKDEAILVATGEKLRPYRIVWWSERQFAKHGNGWDFDGSGFVKPTRWWPLPLPDAPAQRSTTCVDPQTGRYVFREDAAPAQGVSDNRGNYEDRHPKDEVLWSASDLQDHIDVVAELGLEDSHVTPAEAVRELKAELEQARALAKGSAAKIVEECARKVELHAQAMRQDKLTLTADGVSAIAKSLRTDFELGLFDDLAEGTSDKMRHALKRAVAFAKMVIEMDRFTACGEAAPKYLAEFEAALQSPAERPIGYISPVTKHALEIEGTAGHVVASPAYDTDIPVYAAPQSLSQPETDKKG